MAIETAPAFASSTVAGYSVKTSSATSTLGSATNSLSSVTIPTNTDAIENKKFIGGMDVKIAFSDVAGILKLQASHNGTDWVDISTLTSDATPNVTGVKSFLIDTTNIFAPYFRLHFNDDAKSIGTSGTLEFFYAFK